ncbi:hypothetical protein NDU88_006654 [Pleurodeles waltl]|uniref:Uncharacterized protein n=1 Tax=Pleurodeles waltl TaxID=8319 RepID=A0AAV7RQT6_PLEWA|nr:hypothetical protein NDU88_006654 [Pleurodeles waltl]
MAAIRDLRRSISQIEPKLDAVTVEVNLLQTDFGKILEKVKVTETHIEGLLSVTKRLEEHVRSLMKQTLEGDIVRLEAVAENLVQKYALATQHRLYDFGEKASRLLAWLQRVDRECSWVRGITSREGVLQTSSAGIANTFVTYYEDLYAFETRMTWEDCTDFLKDVPLQQLSGEETEVLEVELTEEELVAALRGL